MVDRIGNGGSSLAREAIRAAMESQSRLTDRIRSEAAAVAPGAASEAQKSPEADFASRLTKGIEAVNAEVVKAEKLPSDFVSGKVDDFHEVAVQLKTADISFRFALEVRNKLIDAYREVMRMQV